MIDMINSIKLKSIIPKNYVANFDRENLETDTEINLKFNTELMESATTGTDRVKLIFKATADSFRSSNEQVFSMELTVDYIFDVVNKDLFDTLHGEEKSVLCSSICFLEFRRRLLNAMSSTGLGGLKLPFSLQELQDNKK